MKKLICMLLCLLLATVVFAGCNNTANNPNTPNNPDDPSTPGEKITITIGLPENVNVNDYETNAYTLWLEETTGYNIDVIKYSSSDYKTQFATEAAAGDIKLPDILHAFRFSDDLISEYGEDEYFIDLTPYYEDKEKSKVFWDSMEYLTEAEQETLWAQMHTNAEYFADGTVELGPIYCYPTVEVSFTDNMDFQPMINKEWLQRLNLKAPTTPQELRDVLMAFKTQDANGNGDPNDEIPLLGGAGSTSLGYNIIDWLINFFVYWDDAKYFNVDANGKLYCPITTNEFRQAMVYINGLMADGLLGPSTLSYTMKDVRNVIQNADIVGVTVGHPTVHFHAVNGAVTRWEALDLYGNVFLNDNRTYRDCFITSDCENPDAAWEVIMAMASQEGAIRKYYGEEGIDWDWVDPDTKTTIRKYTNLVGQPTNQCWSQVDCGIIDHPEVELEQGVSGYDYLVAKGELQDAIIEDYKAALEKQDTSMQMPTLVFNTDEEEIAGNYTSMKSDFKKWRAYFIDGTKNPALDADWNAYLQALENAGLKRYQDACQACYDRMYGNNK